MTLFFKSTRFVSFVYAAYKTNQHHALFSILPKASLFHLHSRLQNLQPSNVSLRPIDKSLNNVVQGEFICKEYIERLLHECETSSVSDVTKVPAVEYYAQAPAPTMVDKALQVDFLQLSKSLAKLEMPVLDNRYVPSGNVEEEEEHVYVPTSIKKNRLMASSIYNPFN